MSGVGEQVAPYAYSWIRYRAQARRRAEDGDQCGHRVMSPTVYKLIKYSLHIFFPQFLRTAHTKAANESNILT